MDFFRALNKNARLDPDDIAGLCEHYVMGVTITELGKLFNMRNDKVYEYLNVYYFGQVPKAHQLEVTVQSKINQNDP